MISTDNNTNINTLSVGTIIEDFEIINVLNIGLYGQVYVVKNIFTFKKYVMKSLLKNTTNTKNEVLIHSYLSSSNPNIIKLEKIIEQKDWIYLIIEYSYEGDLFTAITEKSLYFGNHELIRRVFLQLIKQIKFLHENNIYHRDLKPENILIFNGGTKIKLADFGLSTIHQYSNEFGCGSTFYFSPECQGCNSDGCYDTSKNDIWSLGIILINLATCRNPWKIASTNDETFNAYLNDPNLLLKILPISIELNSILKSIFTINPNNRITLDELYLKIQKCKYFTRTSEVIRYETSQLKKKKTKKLSLNIPSTPISSPNSALSSSTSSSSSSSLSSSILNLNISSKKDAKNLDSNYNRIHVY